MFAATCKNLDGIYFPYCQIGCEALEWETTLVTAHSKTSEENLMPSLVCRDCPKDTLSN